MKTYETLTLERRDQIMILRLNRPDALNALNNLMFDELDAYFSNDHAEDEDIRVVIMTGSGDKAFAAGADIKELNALSGSEAEQLSRKGQGIFQKIENFHLPVIAAVNGFALGGGCELAMACHIRVASEKARFGQPEVNLGIIPGYGGTQRLVQLVGKGKAFEWLLTGDMIPAADALQRGLVNHVVAPENLLDTCIAIAEKMLTKGPLALQGVIKAVHAHFQPTVDGYDVEASTFGEVASTEDFMEGTGAFIEKRKPAFRGK